MGMAVSRSLQDLVSETFDFLGRKGTTYVAHIFLEVKLAILKDQVEFIFGIENFFQSELNYQQIVTLLCLGASVL